MNIERSQGSAALSDKDMKASNKDRYICADDNNSCSLLSLAVWSISIMSIVGVVTYFALMHFITNQNHKKVAFGNDTFLRYKNETINIQALFEETSLIGKTRKLSDLNEGELCKIDEMKQEGFEPHQCLTNNQCKGQRVCTTFGWCRGKSLCTSDARTSACNIKEKAGEKCDSDMDCKGARICDDYSKTCDGTDKCN